MTSSPPPEEPRSQPGRSDDAWSRPDDATTPDPSAPGDYEQPEQTWSPPGPSQPSWSAPSGSSQPSWSAPSGSSQPSWSAPAPGQPPWPGPPPPEERPFDPYRFGPPEPSQFESFPTAAQSHQYVRPQTGNGKATAGLVLGILALILSFLTLFDIPLIVLGIVFSVLGLRAAGRGAGGRGMAIAGLTCAIVGAIIAATLFIVVYNRAKDCADRFDIGSDAYQTCLRQGVNR